jgi:ribosomal protein S18 acetylase RimI-like enzyme
LNIRPATPNDFLVIKSIADSAYARYVAAIGKKPAPMVADFAAQISAGHVSVAAEDGLVFGFVVAYAEDGVMHLENIAIDPAYQNMGLGGKLVAHVETHARNKRLPAVELYTNEKMTGNLAWYPAIGFRETGRREENGFNRVFFRKDL